MHGKVSWPSGIGGEWQISWVRRSRLGGDDFDAAIIALGEDAEAYRVRLMADNAVLHTWESDAPTFTLSTQTRTQQRAAHGSTAHWCLEIAQINSRGAAGAPLHIPLAMNEES